MSSTTTKAVTQSDWYLDNLRGLIVIFAASITSFLVSFAAIVTFTRARFAGRFGHKHESMDPPELVMIKIHTRLTRALSLTGMALQVMLLLRLVNTADDIHKSPTYSFSLFRPFCNICAYVLGFTTNTHAFFRMLSLLLLAEIIATDTVAEVALAMVANCLRVQGLHCGADVLSSLPLSTLEFLLTRERVSLFVTPWLMLEVGYLGISIGFCSSRYSRRGLSLSRPRPNIRAVLAQYFPDQFGVRYAHADALHRSRATTQRWKV